MTTTATTASVATVATVTAANPAAVDERKKLARAVTTALANRSGKALAIQTAMVGLIEPMVAWGAKEIKEDLALNSIFKLEIRGDDVSRLAQWVEEFTPVKVKFDKDTGRFTGFGWNQRKIDLARKDPIANPPAWDLAGARESLWTEFTPVNRKLKAKPDIKRGMDAAVREIARAIDLGLVDWGTVKTAIAARMVDGIAEETTKMMDTESHKDWIAAYRKDHNLR